MTDVFDVKKRQKTIEASLILPQSVELSRSKTQKSCLWQAPAATTCVKEIRTQHIYYRYTFFPACNKKLT